jgi:hypothetical protein
LRRILPRKGKEIPTACPYIQPPPSHHSLRLDLTHKDLYGFHLGYSVAGDLHLLFHELSPVQPKVGLEKRCRKEAVTLIRRFLTIQHQLNPLHLYCRLLDKGLSREASAVLCRYYEVLVFVWLSAILKLCIHFCCLLNRSCSIREEMRKG